MWLMDNKKIALAVAALAIIIAAAFGYSTSRGVKSKTSSAKAEITEKQENRLREACASSGTYDRLKEVVFEEALRIRNSDPANLDTLATHSVVRMENPVVKSRDDDLNVTVCTGRFVLDLPPGAEAGFGGQRRLFADIEYAAQASADGSGLVYQMNGAEPIIYKLAAFDLQRQRMAAPAVQPGTVMTDAGGAATAPAPPVPALAPAPVRELESEPRVVQREAPPPPRPRPVEPRPEPRSEPRVEPRVEPRPEPVRAAASSKPSFNCRSARSRSERMVCSSDSLAGLDRAMSSLFYSALADADPGTRAQLRRTRDRFLAYRERCGSEACVAEAYDGRMREIRDIMANATD
jgi:hypothetical protein